LGRVGAEGPWASAARPGAQRGWPSGGSRSRGRQGDDREHPRPAVSRSWDDARAVASFAFRHASAPALVAPADAKAGPFDADGSSSRTVDLPAFHLLRDGRAGPSPVSRPAWAGPRGGRTAGGEPSTLVSTPGQAGPCLDQGSRSRPGQRGRCSGNGRNGGARMDARTVALPGRVLCARRRQTVQSSCVHAANRTPTPPECRGRGDSGRRVAGQRPPCLASRPQPAAGGLVGQLTVGAGRLLGPVASTGDELVTAGAPGGAGSCADALGPMLPPLWDHQGDGKPGRVRVHRSTTRRDASRPCAASGHRHGCANGVHRAGWGRDHLAKTVAGIGRGERGRRRLLVDRVPTVRPGPPACCSPALADGAGQARRGLPGQTPLAAVCRVW